jgi:hypothetical protein
VDATPAYEGYQGIAGGFYKWVFGSDFKHLPLNGLVWMPEGEGPFPIALIVHGNHKATEYSDPGYAYLGEHFASRGFITVSVDENFLNGHALWDGSGNEMPIRAWLLLKHLQVWRGWNAEPGNPFYGKVDLDRVVLMGHSRGAEAATHAAMLNTKIDRPLTAVAKDGEFGFGIRGVVAIAPPDGQYKPYGRERKLLDVSYLLLQGGHDQDLSSAVGMRQYSRTKFESNPDAFKAVAYVYRANHGNYNTVWGSADHGPSASMLLNRAGLLEAEEQRTTGRVFMTAFLEATLHDESDYRRVFITPAGARDWLPDDIYVTQYQDATFKVVNAHDRLSKLESAELKQAKVQASGLNKPLKPELPLRDQQMQGNRALFAQWAPHGNPTYTLVLPQGADAEFAVSAEDRLVFSLGNAMNDATPLYVTVELVDATGEVTTQPANRFGIVPPPMPAKLEKSNRVSKVLGSEFFPKVTTPYERMLQSFEIPLSAFVAANPDFDPTQVEIIRFRFNDEMSGQMYVDEVGFRGLARWGGAAPAPPGAGAAAPMRRAARLFSDSPSLLRRDRHREDVGRRSRTGRDASSNPIILRARQDEGEPRLAHLHPLIRLSVRHADHREVGVEVRRRQRDAHRLPRQRAHQIGAAAGVAHAILQACDRRARRELDALTLRRRRRGRRAAHDDLDVERSRARRAEAEELPVRPAELPLVAVSAGLRRRDHADADVRRLPARSRSRQRHPQRMPHLRSAHHLDRVHRLPRTPRARAVVPYAPRLNERRAWR